MSDEQTIYISPDDDLTTVRERLESIQARRVMLVIPSQTQLRSHVAWKLLYASMRELGKDVLIVSSDPQIRSVAHAVKFNVAHSLESSQVNRTTRVPSHPTRNNTPPRNRPTSNIARSVPPAAARPNPVEAERTLRKQPVEPQNPSSLFPRSRFQPNEQQPRSAADDELRRDRGESSARNRYSPSYEYSIKRPSPILPLEQEQIDEEPDMLIEDYQQSQNIRANVGKQASAESPAIEKTPPAPFILDEDDDEVEQEPGQPRVQRAKDDPFSVLADNQSFPTAEQRGGVSLAGNETQEHIIQDAPEVQTSFINASRSVPEPAANPRPLQKPTGRPSRPIEITNNQDALRDSQRRPIPYREAPPRIRNNSASLRSQPLLRSQQEEDALPPVTPIGNQAQKRSSKALQPTNRPEGRIENRAEPMTRGATRVQPVPMPATTAARQQRISAGLGSPAASASSARLSGQLQTPLRPSRGLRPAPPPGQLATSRRNKRRGSWLAFLVILVVIVLLGLALFVPTASVKIVVQSHDYAHVVNVTAHPTVDKNQSDTVVAHRYTHTFQATGQGKATGTKTVNKARATGNVCFINSGDNSVEIPTGSTVATNQNAVQFTTTADVVIGAHSTCASSPPDPVQAVNAGENGNVAAGLVTLIPTSSLNAIAEYNKTSASNLKLTVTNPAAIGGGGMQPFPAVTTADRTNVQKTLHQQLQGDVMNWLKTLPQSGVTGKPFASDTLINTPAVDTVINSGNTFSATVQENVTVLFVATVDLQKAATTQLNTAIHNDKTYAGYDVIQDAFEQVKITQVKQQDPAADTLDISYNATAKAAPTIEQSTVQDQAKGKTINGARTEILQKLQSRGVQQVEITVTPRFVPWVTPLSGRIQVQELPTSTQVTQPMK